MTEIQLVLTREILLRAGELCCYCFFLSGVPKRRRFLVVCPCYILIFTALYVGAFLLFGDPYPFFTYFYYPVLLLFLLALYNIRVADAFYYLILIFLCVHPFRQLTIRIISIVFPMSPTAWVTALGEDLIVTALLCLFLCVLFVLLKPRVFRFSDQRISWSTIGWMFIVTIPVLFLSNLGIWMGLDQDNLPSIVPIISSISSICSMVAVVGYGNALALSRKEQELVQMEAILHGQQSQYELKKNTVELIDQRYHDLKNHLLYLETTGNNAACSEYAEGLRKEIRAYESLYNTGNDALNIILTSKGLECEQKEISLVLLLDGSKLNFMHPVDIATVFGNAIDNAIEALCNVAPSLRELDVHMSERGAWLCLRFENRYAATVRMEDDYPVSNKPADGTLHGLGLKSIEYVVKKYGGHMCVEAQDQHFILSILLPQNQETLQVPLL